MFLEMIVPGEIHKPLMSMEHVLSNLWSLYSNIHGWKNFRKKWIIGKRFESFCVEIVSDGPNPRFFIRIDRAHIDTTKTAFYSQYPEIELREVREDYLREVSWNMPDRHWNLYGMDQKLCNDDCYPIKTYTQFFEMKPENLKDEKRIDPINSLLESFSNLKPEEKIWVQIRLMPATKNETDFLARGKKLINKLVHRKEEANDSMAIKTLNAVGDLVSVSSSKEEKKKDEKKELIPPEMKLTPREREIVELVERKMSKNIFLTNIRGLYLCNGKNFDPGRKALIESYFSSFSLPDQNEFGKMRETKTKILHFIIKRRLNLRKRKIFRRYVMRETPFHPLGGGTFVLNTEELATIIHPPVELGKTGMKASAAEIKRAAAPKNLPM